MLLAIDPGPTESAFVVWSGEKTLELGIFRNESLLKEILPSVFRKYPGIEMVVEEVASYGMPVGRTVFETVYWTGRFIQAWVGTCPECNQGVAHRAKRIDVKMHLCHNSCAKDSNIRQALIDRFEPDLKPKCRPKDKLRGVSKDCWAALALAVYFDDTQTHKDDC